jgi:hypothetical protein
MAVLLLSGSVALRNFSHPFAVNGGIYSDHFSHVGSTVLFAAKRLDIYRHTVQQNLTRSEARKDLAYAEANQLGTAELYVNPLDPARPPLAINWSFQIRAYPPGVYVLFAPLAFLFQHEIVGFAMSNRIIIGVLVLVASASAWMLVRWSLSPRLVSGSAGMGLRLVPVALSILWIALWSVRGFYDVVPLMLVFLSLRALEADDGIGALLWYCLAAFLHYRALYYLPVVGFALPSIVRVGRTRGFASMFLRPAVVLALLAAAASAVTFLIALPQLESFRANNALYHAWSHARSQVWLLGVAAACIALSAAARDFRTAACLGCYLVFLVNTPQTYPWHTLFLTPMLVLAARHSTGRAANAQVIATVTLAVALAIGVYGVSSDTLGW